MWKAGWIALAGWIGLLQGLALTGLVTPALAQGTVIAAPRKDPMHPGLKPSGIDTRGGKKAQRMLLAPGCYVLMPGSVYAASAYCVDKDAPAAQPGIGLSPAPSGPGDTVVRVGTESLSLQAAVTNKLVALESLGRGDYFHISIRNLSASKLEICVRTATVIAAGSAPSGSDLTALKGKIEALLPPLKDPHLGSSATVYGSADELHAVIQQKLWAETSRARKKARMKLDLLDDPESAPPADCPRSTDPNLPAEPTVELKCGR